MSDTNVFEVKNASPVVIPSPLPSAAKVLQDPLQPARTQEQIDHEKLIINRPRRLERDMMSFAALGISPGVKSLKVVGGIYELGTLTYFTVRRVWGTAMDGRSSAVTILYSGYKARLQGGKIVIGGADNNVCAYDLRFRPFDNACSWGKILSSKKRTTLRLGLILDESIERVTKGVESPSPMIVLPQFWAAYPVDSLPAVEDCQAARKLALEVVRPGYEGPVLPSLRSPGGVVSAVCPDAEGGIGVLFNEGTPQESAVILPRTAVLRPYVREGFHIAEGVSLADFLPRRMYPNLRKVAELYGEDIAEWLLQDAVFSTDQMIDGLFCRRVEFCPSQLEHAVKLYEDVRHLVDPATGVVRPQVIRMKSPASLQVSRGEAVSADFYTVRVQWNSKFQPTRR